MIEKTPRLKIVFDSSCLDFGEPGHPESPERIAVTALVLKERNYTFIKPGPCTESDLLRVHTSRMITEVRHNMFIDMDTPPLPGIYDYALQAAGGAVTALETARTEGAAFSLMRPPGHHATRNRVMGFCYINNMAVAVARHLAGAPESRIAVLDIDVHHGNGTEDIFLGNKHVLYVSLHQLPLFPGTGRLSRDNVLNFPLAPGTGEIEYLETLKKALEAVAAFAPGLIGVSAGFDTYAGDPLAHLALPVSAYRKIGEAVTNLGIPVFSLMEGGYSRDMPLCVLEYLEPFETLLTGPGKGS